MGLDVTKHRVPFWENGKSQISDFSFVVRACFSGAIDRLLRAHLFFFPEIFTDRMILPSERDLKANFNEVRNFVMTIWR